MAEAFGAKGALGTGGDLGAEAFTGVAVASLGSLGVALGVGIGPSSAGVASAVVTILSQRQNLREY